MNEENDQSRNSKITSISTANNADEEETIDLGEIFFTLIHKWWLLLLAVIIAAGATFGVSRFFITPEYEATSMIYVLGKTTSISDNINLQLSQQLTVDFQTLATSRPVIEAVIKDCNLDTTYEKLVGTVTVTNPSNTSILKMTAVNTSPQLACDISNALSEETANRIAEVMVTDKPSQVESAVVPTTQSSPHVLKNTAIGGLIGLLLMAAFIIILHISDDSIKTEDDVRKYMDLATLAVFPQDESLANDEKKSRRSSRHHKAKTA